MQAQNYIHTWYDTLMKHPQFIEKVFVMCNEEAKKWGKLQTPLFNLDKGNKGKQFMKMILSMLCHTTLIRRLICSQWDNSKFFNQGHTFCVQDMSFILLQPFLFLNTPDSDRQHPSDSAPNTMLPISPQMNFESMLHSSMKFYTMLLHLGNIKTCGSSQVGWSFAPPPCMSQDIAA